MRSNVKRRTAQLTFFVPIGLADVVAARKAVGKAFSLTGKLLTLVMIFVLKYSARNFFLPFLAPWGILRPSESFRKYPSEMELNIRKSLIHRAYLGGNRQKGTGFLRVEDVCQEFTFWRLGTMPPNKRAKRVDLFFAKQAVFRAWKGLFQGGWMCALD